MDHNWGQCRSSVPTPRAAWQPRDKVMLINHDRIAYVGLLGSPKQRNLGSLTLYISLANPFRIRIGDDSWHTTRFAIVQPYLPHWVATDDRLIGVVMIEPEYIDPADLPTALVPGIRPPEHSDTANQLYEGFARLCGQTHLSTRDFDELFFGARLVTRPLDHRIAQIAERIRAEPCELHDAESSASQAGLSFSRFLHLFANEVGVNYRRYRAWKRARALLPYVAQTRNLTDVALELGYPDSTHFSHSIRSVYGLRPKDIFAGSRRLSVIVQPGAARPLTCAA